LATTCSNRIGQCRAAGRDSHVDPVAVGNRRQCRLDNPPDIDRARPEQEGARLQAAHVVQIVGQASDPFGLSADGLPHSPDAVGRQLAGVGLDGGPKPENRCQRCAQIVGNQSEELVFVGIQIPCRGFIAHDALKAN
jgi:hypothetical protein